MSGGLFEPNDAPGEISPDLYPTDFDPAAVEVPPVPDHLQTLYTFEQWRAIYIGDLQAAHERKEAAARRKERASRGT
jgi:hypothetical protein